LYGVVLCCVVVYCNAIEEKSGSLSRVLHMNRK